MENYKNIPIKNVYYMLSYAFAELKHEQYKKVAHEDFEDIFDLFAQILTIGISTLLKKGLHREYILCVDELNTLRGKLSITDTIKKRITNNRHLVCEFDTFSENNVFNQIIRTSVNILLHHQDVNTKRKAALRSLMIYFDNVDEIAVNNIRWRSLRYDSNSRTYEMIHNLCYLLLQSKLLTTEDGAYKIEKFSDKNMALLFEHFVLNYYKKEHPKFHACAREINWDLTPLEQAVSSTAGTTDGTQDDLSNYSATPKNGLSMLPKMKTDITLTLGDRTLIIDTKFYEKNTQEHFGKNTVRSHNLYQIHTYVHSLDYMHTGKVDGLLLYAHTNAEIQADLRPHKTSDGNIFMVKTLDLSQDFSEIKNQLESLVKYYNSAQLQPNSSQSST